MLTGIKIANDADVEKVAEDICAMGVKNVIITLGSKGCLIREEGVSYRIDAFKVEPVDTTAAGDTFKWGISITTGSWC